MGLIGISLKGYPILVIPKKNKIKFSPLKLPSNPSPKIEYQREQWEGIGEIKKSSKGKKKVEVGRKISSVVQEEIGDESQDNQEDIKRRAKEIKNKLNGGKNSVTIETDNRRIRYDLDGKAHHEKPLDKKIDTPHKVKYVRNVNPKNPTLSNWSKKGGVKPMSHEDLDIVEDYLKNKKKKDK